MTYAGNRSLAPEIRERILGTFRQTLDLASSGSREEAGLGCDFILRLDPEFTPARSLADRLQGGQGPVEVSDLAPHAEEGGTAVTPEAREREAEELFGGTPAAGAGGPPAGLADPGPSPGGPGGDRFATSEMPAAEDPFASASAPSGAGSSYEAADPLDLGDLGELDDLDLDPPSPAPHASEAQPSAAASVGGSGSTSLAAELGTLVSERRFEEAVERAQARPEAVAAEPRAAELAGLAQERLEAKPYVESFVRNAEKAVAEGRSTEAARALEKASSLDPEHPRIAELRRGLEAGTADPAASDPFASPAGAPVAFGQDEESGRIRELLDEGQARFDDGDYQGAIDNWSRIFLIDIDHAEAARRIDEARRLKAEQERVVEERFHEAEAALAAGDTETARERLALVLKLHPGHVAAREYVDQLQAGETPEVAAKSEPAPSAAAPPPALEEEEELKEEILVPPEPGQAGPAPGEDPMAHRRVAATAPARGGLLFLLIGGGVLLVALVAGWFVFSNRDQMFPNSDAPAAAGTPAEALDPVARAERLREAGRTDAALRVLAGVPEGDPRHAEAEALLQQWEAEEAAAFEEGAEADGQGALFGADGRPSLAEVEAERREELLRRGRAAARAGENLRASDAFSRAAAIAPLAAEDEELRLAADARLEPLAHHIELLRGGDWEFALPELWRMHQGDPDNRDVTHLLGDAYYNLGVRDLQRGDVPSAAEHLGEAAALMPDDEQVARHLRFAETYSSRNKDLLYRIYVKYLPFR